MKLFFVLLLTFVLTLPASSFAVNQEDVMKKMQDLTRQLEELKKQMEELKQEGQIRDARVSAAEERAEEAVSMWPSWLEIGGDYRFRFDSLKGKVQEHMLYNPFSPYPVSGFPAAGMTTLFLSSPTEGYTVKNNSVMFNRFRLKLKARVTENIRLKARLAMYKTWGHETMSPTQGNFFGDRAMGPFDGTVGHVPEDSVLRVDYAYVTWSNIFDLPVWFSVGRRASTEGAPTNLRQNVEKTGTAGVAGLLIDYAFDGLTVGVAPDIEMLPGFYAKLCYGRGYESGFKTDISGLTTPKDTDFLGIFVDPIFTDNLNVELQWIRGFNIFNTLPDGMPMMVDTGLMGGGEPTGTYIEVNTPVSENLGDIDLFGAFVMNKFENVGIGDLNVFVSGAISKTRPTTNLFSMPFFSMDGGATWMNAGYGMLYDDDPMTPKVDTESHTGNAIYLGARYDIKKTGTKIGLEYNRGSKYWITFTPAADDIWTSKLGTRGEVYEAYIIQELPEIPIAKLGKAFIRLGYQYYKFEYTGSNSWIGEPKKIDDLTTTDPMGTQMFAPLKNAQDIYLTFDVTF